MAFPQNHTLPIKNKLEIGAALATPVEWHSIAGLLADVAFEGDLAARFTAFGADDVLGHPASALLGTSLGTFFPGPEGAYHSIIATIGAEQLVWQGKITVQDAQGNVGPYRLALAPRLDKRGHFTGIYGLLIALDAPVPAMGQVTNLSAEAALSSLLCAETALWQRPSFADQVARRSDRLDVEDLPGTLILIGFANASASLRACVAVRIAEELREIIRPTDLLGRIAPACIALWCDGMDHLTGGERASRFCKTLPGCVPGQGLMSVGMVTRWPGSGDDPETLLTRAEQALQNAETATSQQATGHWRVWSQAEAG